MDQSHGEQGHAALVVSVLTGFLGWISSAQVDETLKFTSMCVSILAGIMAIRHYYLQSKPKK